MSNPTDITAEPGVPFVETVREFDAPVDAVYRAHVEPELLVQWLGPRRDTIKNVQYDTRVGGRSRISIHDVYPTVEARDMAIGSGMNSGVIEGYERLDELFATQAA